MWFVVVALLLVALVVRLLFLLRKPKNDTIPPNSSSIAEILPVSSWDSSGESETRPRRGGSNITLKKHGGTKSGTKIRSTILNKPNFVSNAERLTTAISAPANNRESEWRDHFKTKNEHLDQWTEMDLHGLTREQALTILSEKLHEPEHVPKKGFIVITGRGRHSDKNSGPVLFAEVKKFLLKHYPIDIFTIESDQHKGQLRIVKTERLKAIQHHTLDNPEAKKQEQADRKKYIKSKQRAGGDRAFPRKSKC